MVVVTLTDCPPKLRGDLTKWLMEINTGVYVGKVSARIREMLWTRICENLSQGRATMVYSTNNEQGMEFCVHNSAWKPMDFDGIQLIMRPEHAQCETKARASRAEVQQMLIKKKQSQTYKAREEGYVVIDLETTGLNSSSDEIIELAAIRIINHKIADQLEVLVKTEKEVPKVITELTGITEEILEEKGVVLSSAMEMFCKFIGESTIVGHNIAFDRSFLKEACRRTNRMNLNNPAKDTLDLARRRIDDIDDYKLRALADYFQIKVEEEHRALSDCITTFQVYEKLNEI